jgi:hypothetical protein
MNLEGVAQELYAAAPEEFVGLRAAQVAAAKKAKDKQLATAVGALRRPTRSAWLVNQLARESSAELAELLDLGEALAQAQRDAAGPELRKLSAQRHAAVDALVRRTVEIGAAHGHQASEATRQEVGQILTGALADPELAGVVRAGRVTQAVAYGGFGPDLQLGSGTGPALAAPVSLDERRARKSAKAGTSAKSADELAEEQRQQAHADAEAALQALDAARAAQTEAEQADAEAHDALAEAEQAIAAARRELADREKARERAQRAVKDATRRADHRRTEAAEAEQSAARAATELRRLDS